jgi:hypothetical protein
MKRIFLLLGAATMVFASCKKDGNNDGIFKGPVTKFQHGKAWTWIEIDGQNKPERIGISIDDEAMNSLEPGTAEEGGKHQHVNSLSLQFHPKASVTPFTHALLDWNPNGHEPAGLYDKPHFDFHFYIIPESERMAIPAYETDSTGFLNYPTPGYTPATYVPTPGGVPQMGTHWIDFTSPEFNGQPFTQTFLYGTYNGKVAFYEPMITKAFLDANATFERPFGVPARFKESGYYPTKMRIVKTEGATHIILEEFVYRAQS